MAQLYLHGKQNRHNCWEWDWHVELQRTELQHTLLHHLHLDRVPAVAVPGPGSSQVLWLLQISDSTNSGDYLNIDFDHHRQLLTSPSPGPRSVSGLRNCLKDCYISPSHPATTTTHSFPQLPEGLRGCLRGGSIKHESEFTRQSNGRWPVHFF